MTKPVSGDYILRRERRPETVCFPCSADHKQDFGDFSLNHSSINESLGPIILYLSDDITTNHHHPTTIKYN